MARTLDNVEGGAVLALGILVDVHGGIALNVDEGAGRENVNAILVATALEHNVPAGKAEHEVTAGALSKGSDAEPAGLAVLLGAAVAGDSISDNFAAGGGLVELRGVGEVADDGDLSNGSGRGGAEGAGGGGRCDGSTTEEERRHVDKVALVSLGERESVG